MRGTMRRGSGGVRDDQAQTMNCHVIHPCQEECHIYTHKLLLRNYTPRFETPCTFRRLHGGVNEDEIAKI